jgi:hypothetical protein
MFCSKCGTENAETATVCVKCSAPIPGHHSTPSHTAEAMKGAGKDALEAFMMFAKNPVPGLPKAFESLGAARALGAGLGFGIVSALCFVIGLVISLHGFPPMSIFFKILLCAIVPYASLVGGCFGANLVFGGKGSIQHACFIAGAASLPFAIMFLAAGIFGSGNVTYFLSIFALSTSILLLFSGCVRILFMSEGAATIALPLMIIVTAWLTYEIVMRIIFSGMMSGFSSPNMNMGGPPY